MNPENLKGSSIYGNVSSYANREERRKNGKRSGFKISAKLNTK